MKSGRLLAVALIAVLPCACGVGSHAVRAPASTQPSTAVQSPTSSESETSAAATAQIVVRPVTASGLLAPGFGTSHGTDTVTCSVGAAASPAAVDNDIVACTPEASDAVACWAAADPGHVFCLRDPWAEDVVELPLADHVPHVTAPKHPHPLGLTLADGTHCDLRVGGTSTVLVGHPTWFAAFICNATTAVWGPPTGDGIDTSGPMWTVHVAALDGTGALATTTVTDAYYAGTAN